MYLIVFQGQIPLIFVYKVGMHKIDSYIHFMKKYYSRESADYYY